MVAFHATARDSTSSVSAVQCMIFNQSSWSTLIQLRSFYHNGNFQSDVKFVKLACFIWWTCSTRQFRTVHFWGFYVPHVWKYVDHVQHMKLTRFKCWKKLEPLTHGGITAHLVAALLGRVIVWSVVKLAVIFVDIPAVMTEVLVGVSVIASFATRFKQSFAYLGICLNWIFHLHRVPELNFKNISQIMSKEPVNTLVKTTGEIEGK